MIIAVGSLKGSPGATTLALALADRWPAGSEPLVVEADPAGGDLGARFGLGAAQGLVTLAAAGRRGSGEPRPLSDHTQELPGGLEVITAPAGAEQARQVLGELAGGGWSLLWSAARQGGRAVIVDCGRLDPLSPATPAVRAADVLLLVARARDDELSQLAARMHVVQGWGLPAWYVVVAGQADRSQDYPIRDIVRVLGSHVLGTVPYDAAAASVLGGRRRTRTGITRSKLGRAVTDLARHLANGEVPDQGTPAGWLPALPDGPAARTALPRARTEAP
ncbi:hypothetical protein [Frankia sp. Cas4]|uniref:hypothetical protein n=1 Tax=Frankia sp. Cas4 TaxID=3073927 RepID=UPI002AD2A877|nr:hypothetical protein [Frankia sp. Cas4]